ncbi:MAG: hypothetical protein JRD93_05625 [Deltaproteobacteria bacterium]|nr:hypothetical protein [Deltaproteobacteria bacterium]
MEKIFFGKGCNIKFNLLVKKIMNKIKRIGMVMALTLALSLSVSSHAMAALTMNTTTVSGSGALTLTGATASTWSTAAGDITIEAGTTTAASVILLSNQNAVDAVYLHADGGTSDGIKIHSDQGTGVASIHLLSDVGGATIDTSGDNKEIRLTTGTGDVVIAGSASGTDALTITAGDVLLTSGLFDMTIGDMTLADGSITVTDADNAATLSVTNNTATTASPFVLAGSGVFTGNTTSSFMTVTPSGLTTGTGVYLPLAAMTQGKGLHMVANALTTGNEVNVSSSATAITGAGRLLRVDHTGATGTAAVLSEFASAANDETTIMRVTASDVLATGTALDISADAMTTGTALDAGALDALTTGIGANIESGATAITGAGRVLRVDHTGATGTSAILSEFASAATDETTIMKVTGSAALAAGVALDVSVAAMTTGKAIDVSDLAAITTGKAIHVDATGNTQTDGILVHVDSGSSIATSTGRSLLVDHTGTAGVDTVIAEVKSAATDETTIMKVTGSAALAAGVALDISTVAMTTGKAIDISNLDAITTGKAIHVDATGVTQTDGILVHVDSGSTALTSTGRLLLVDHTAVSGVSTTVAEIKSVAADETIVLGVSGVDLTTGSVLALTGSANSEMTAAGSFIKVSDGTNDVFRVGYNGHITSAATDVANSEPALTVAGGFSGPSETAGNAAGIATDTRGQVVFTADADAGTAILTFGKAYAAAPVCVITPADAEAQANMDFAFVTTSTTVMTINYITGTAATEDTWNYICIE